MRLCINCRKNEVPKERKMYCSRFCCDQDKIGKKFSLERKMAIGKALKGKPKSKEHRIKLSEAAIRKFERGFINPMKGRKGYRTGSLNNMWKGGVSKINKTERQLFMQTIEYKEWRMKVFERDNYTCQMCFDKGGRLEADHIKKYADYPSLRLDISNGRTLCKDCHKSTPTYGCVDRNEKGQFTNCQYV